MTERTKQEQALVVDDTPANRAFLARLLSQVTNLNVLEAATGQEALDMMYVGKYTFDLAIVDMQLPDMSGLQLAMRLGERYPEIVLIVATMYDDHSWIQKSFEMGCSVYLIKPHGFMELYSWLAVGGVGAIRDMDKLIIDQYGPRPYTAHAGKG
jgi:CheY-like chemotaxis protein